MYWSGFRPIYNALTSQVTKAHIGRYLSTHCPQLRAAINGRNPVKSRWRKELSLWHILALPIWIIQNTSLDNMLTREGCCGTEKSCATVSTKVRDDLVAAITHLADCFWCAYFELEILCNCGWTTPDSDCWIRDPPDSSVKFLSDTTTLLE